ncbi:MAG TPA: peptide deformylase [Herpetosiphonaceae bacterium]
MAVLPVRELGDPILRQPAAPFDDPRGSEVARVMADMRDTLGDIRSRTGYGRAMSAPQIGVLKRALLIDYRDQRIELVNPRFERWGREEESRYESCFSFPGIWGLVQRPVSVIVVGWTPAGQELRIEASGTLSRILQHEMDHLDGLVWLDRDPDLHSVCTTAEYEKRYTSR